MNELFTTEAAHVIQIEFDGGCSPNPGMKYGSYAIRLDGKETQRKERFSLGHGTNNEAEFEALLAALKCVTENPMPQWSQTRIVILTDSTIVRNHLQRTFAIRKTAEHKADRRMAMIALANRCKETLRQFHSFEAQWQTREKNVANFGH